MKKAKSRETILIHEKHHIIPKSLGGKNDIDNIVKLTPREHFISHALLLKMVHEKKHRRAMAYAFVKMKTSNNKQGYSRIGNGRLYERLKISIREIMSGENNPFHGNHSMSGENNPFYGKKHSIESKRKMSISQRGKSGPLNYFYGKHHTDENKKRFSDNERLPITIIFKNGQIIKFDRRKDIGPYLNKCEALGIQLCTIKRHLWDKYNIEDMYEDS